LRVCLILVARSSVARPTASVPPASPPVAPSAARGASIGLHCDHCGRYGHMNTFCYGKKKAQKAQARRSSQGSRGSSSGGSERSSASLETQELLMLLHHLAPSTLSGAIGSVTQPSALTGSATRSQSSTLGPPFAPSPGTYPWYFDSGASFHMTPYSTHLSSLLLSYQHFIIHTTDGSPLSVARQCTLCSDSFHVPDVSVVPNPTMQLMSAGQITDHDCRAILDSDFCYIQNRRTGHLVGTGPVTMIHSAFGSMTGFIFFPLCLPVLSALPLLLHPCRHLLSGIIIWATFVTPDCLLCFIEVF
jgi:hypothetical protein